MTCTVTKKEISEVKAALASGCSYSNEKAGYQFVKRTDGLMLKFSNDKYTFFTNEDAFARAIVRAIKRGY